METLESAPPSKNRGRLAVTVGVGLVAIAVVAAGILLIPRLLNPGASTVNVTAAAMPADTQLYLSFNPHFEQLPNGGVIRQAWSDPELSKPLEDQVRAALEDANLDWEQDIASWLGDEIGIGLVDIPLNSAGSFGNTSAPPVVLAAATRDKTKSDALLAKLRAKVEAGGETFTEQTYRAVTVFVSDATELPAYATVKDLVLIATGESQLHAAIDAVLDGKGLNTSSSYAATVNRLRGGRAMTIYANLAPLYQELIEQMEQSGAAGASFSGVADALAMLQGGALGLSFETNGLLLEVIGQGDPGKLPADQQAILSAAPNPNTLLRTAPDTAFLYLGGYQFAERIKATLSAMRSLDPNLQDALDNLEQETGINLEEDILSWMKGEIALVAMPGAGLGGSSQIPFGLALIVETADQQLAEERTHQLIQTLTAQSGQTLEAVTIGDANLHALVDASGQSMFVYGVLGDKFVLALPENSAQKIAGAGDRPLADDATFKTAIAPLPKNNDGYQYLRPKTIVDLASLALSFSGQPCTVCPLFEPVSAVAIAAEQPQYQNGVERTILFMLLDVAQ
ncbi:MAG TPA: DUF3352 domain-containing protein [Anaerolineae bacterium]|nr:DUF3352 domain-containing protein [Anaerolineae bacterium]